MFRQHHRKIHLCAARIGNNLSREMGGQSPWHILVTGSIQECLQLRVDGRASQHHQTAAWARSGQGRREWVLQWRSKRVGRNRVGGNREAGDCSSPITAVLTAASMSENLRSAKSKAENLAIISAFLAIAWCARFALASHHPMALAITGVNEMTMKKTGLPRPSITHPSTPAAARVVARVARSAYTEHLPRSTHSICGEPGGPFTLRENVLGGPYFGLHRVATIFWVAKGVQIMKTKCT